jgi:uncharacterized protein
MKVAAIIEYLQDSAKVSEIRPAHRQYLTSLIEQGKLVASGPFLDESGALIIYEAESIEAAEAILKGDPFYASGVFLTWKLRPWKPVLANVELLPGKTL